MPRIINAYADNSVLGDTLSRLGEAIYGDQAAREVNRQKAFGQKNINDLATDGSVGLDDPRLAKAQLAIGGSASGTFPGQGRALANDRWTNAATNAAGERNNVRNNAETHYGTDRRYDSDIATTGMNNDTQLKVGAGNNDATRDVARIQADKTAASDKYRFDNTYENTFDPETGRTVLTPRSQAAGREVAPTKDSVVGSMLRKVADGQQVGGAGATGIDAGNPFASLSPQVQHVAGVDMPEQSLIEPRSGMTGISRDGGQTIILPNGARIPATGFQPVGQDAALTQARDNNVRAGAANPLVVGDPSKSKAAADAAATSGIGPRVGTFFNDELGSLPLGPAIIKGISGSPEIAPDTQRARSAQDVRNNQARAVLLGGPGRQTVQAQKWVNDLIPQGDAMSNPETEAAKIPTIVKALAGDHEQLRQLAIDPNTLPAERVKLVQQLHTIENTIRMYTDPAPASPAAAAATPQSAAPSGGQAAAPQGPTQTATNPQTGQKLGLVNGQWVPLSGSDGGAGKPPAPQSGPGDPLSQARDAIARGADPAAVRQRLQQNGIDPAALSKPQQVIQNGHTYTLQPDGSYR